ncbi:unnamed protein product [Mytilus coruscus]|uniref:Endonuclease/exonuclease/phosphatase domain-containing protein n=1 Tax=Mytilus coruscus TaxID=42192 RepID=A0A6J8CYN8_MYTCO|nr:unnamed protein product [Mytilus coruscus]
MNEGPNMQLTIIPTAYEKEAVEDPFLSLKEEVVKEHLKHVYSNSFQVIIYFMKPKSEGYMELVSTNPVDHPLLDPNYLSHPDDVVKEHLKRVNSNSFPFTRGDILLLVLKVVKEHLKRVNSNSFQFTRGDILLLVLKFVKEHLKRVNSNSFPFTRGDILLLVLKFVKEHLKRVNSNSLSFTRGDILLLVLKVVKEHLKRVNSNSLSFTRGDILLLVLQFVKEHLKHVYSNSFQVIIYFMKPKSEGYMELVSTNPVDHPLLDPNYLSHPDDVKTVIEGDFNWVLDKDRDRHPVHSRNDIGHDELNYMIDKNNLCDAWRTLNPEARRYTFNRTNTKSRIDYMLVSKDLLNKMTNVKITHFPFSDHDLV